jgi:TctA family transporter
MMQDETPKAGSAEAGTRHRVSTTRKVAIGCFTSWLGFVSGAMVAALLSKFTAFLMKSKDCDGIPSCNWYIWAVIGGLVGAVTLPIMVLWVLGKPAKSGKPDAGF